MEKPTKPGLGECCGGGSCCPCVIDDYIEKLNLWKKAQAAKAGLDKPDDEPVKKKKEALTAEERAERRMYR